MPFQIDQIGYFVDKWQEIVVITVYANTASRYLEKNLKSTNILSHSLIKKTWCKNIKYFRKIL